MTEHKTELLFLTPAAGKRLIAKAVCALDSVRQAYAAHTLVVVAGTTNYYVAQELFAGPAAGQKADLRHFYRGITLAPGFRRTEPAVPFSGDLVFKQGVLQPGQSIYDAAPALGRGDVIIKGVNALDAARQTAGILIGNEKVGTSAPILEAVVGRRAHLVLPVGLEKRVPGDMMQLAAGLDGSRANGPRLLPVTGEIVTELEAFSALFGVQAELAAAGGVGGAEGGCWFAVTGTPEQLDALAAALKPVAAEPAFSV